MRAWLARSSAFCRGGAVVDERQLDIVQRGGAGEQVEGLEDESDLLVADAGEFIVVQFADEVTVQPVVALAGGIEAADEVHQRGFAGTGRSHDGDVFVVLDADGDAAQSMDLLLRAHIVGLPQIFNDDHVSIRYDWRFDCGRVARYLSFHAILLSLRSKLFLTDCEASRSVAGLGVDCSKRSAWLSFQLRRVYVRDQDVDSPSLTGFGVLSGFTSAPLLSTLSVL